MMNDILRPYLDKFVLVYLDDIVVFSATADEHAKHVKEILTTLAKHDLILSENKCTWAESSLIYLGHVLDGKAIRTNPRKVDKIRDWPIPKTITDVRGFINPAKYYKRFVPSFSALMLPLYDLTSGTKETCTYHLDRQMSTIILRHQRSTHMYRLTSPPATICTLRYL
jgi:hypothetical protein